MCLLRVCAQMISDVFVLLVMYSWVHVCASCDNVYFLAGFLSNIAPVNSAPITTPVNHHRLWSCLQGYPNKEFICKGFQTGFNLGIVGNIHPSPRRSYRSGHGDNAQAFLSKLNVELSMKRVLGPYDSPPDNVIVSPLYVIPKNSTPGKYRLIHNLSSPRGKSVNDIIDPLMRTVSYCSVLDVASYLKDQQTGGPWYMAKVDLKDAYRCVPIAVQDRRYLGMQYRDKYYVDTCLPMGCSSSCFLFQSVSDSLSWIFQKRIQTLKYSLTLITFSL